MKRNCLKCNKEFRTYPSKIKLGRGKYCSKECAKIIYFPKGHIPWSKGLKGLNMNNKGVPRTEEWENYFNFNLETRGFLWQ